MTEQNEIVIYKPNFESQIEVRVEKDTVWLTQAQIAELFGVGQPAISKHIKNIYSSGELPVEGTYSILEYMGNDGKLTLKTSDKVHDRFLILDDEHLYLIGASLKDLGKRLFAFIEMDGVYILELKEKF